MQNNKHLENSFFQVPAVKNSVFLPPEYEITHGGFNMTLGKKIYTLRTKMGLTQEQLAEQLGVSRQSISKYEYGQSTPELEKIKMLAAIFGTTPDSLINDEIDITEQEKVETDSDNVTDNNTSKDTNFISGQDTDSPSFLEMESAIETLTEKVDSLQAQCDHLNKSYKKNSKVIAFVSICFCISSCIISSTISSFSSRIGHVENAPATQTYYTDSPYEEDLIDETFSSYDFSVKNYNLENNTIDYYITCKPIKYTDNTTISAIITFDNGEQYTGTLSENTGIFRGSVSLPLSEDNFQVGIIINNDGEKQNIDIPYSENLLSYVDWNPALSILPTISENQKNNTMLFSGEAYIQTDDQADIKTTLSSITDVKLVFCTKNYLLFEQTLTDSELKELQKGEPVDIDYKFEYKNDGDYVDLYEVPIQIYLEYQNTMIHKKIRVSINGDSGCNLDIFTSSDSSYDFYINNYPDPSDEESYMKRMIIENDNKESDKQPITVKQGVTIKPGSDTEN